MPIDNLGKAHFSEQQIKDINQALDIVDKIVSSVVVNLSPAERSKYGRVNEQNKLLIDKVRQYRETQPNLSSPEVDWVEYEKDYHNRKAASHMLSKIREMDYALMSIKILGDYDNYTDSLRDYKYSKYKNSFADHPGHSNKIEAMKNFFPKTGKKKKGKKN